MGWVTGSQGPGDSSLEAAPGAMVFAGSRLGAANGLSHSVPGKNIIPQ